MLDPPALLVAAHAESEFEAVALIDPAFWDGVLQVATYQLHITSVEPSTWRPPSLYCDTAMCCVLSTKGSA